MFLSYIYVILRDSIEITAGTPPTLEKGLHGLKASFHALIYIVRVRPSTMFSFVTALLFCFAGTSLDLTSVSGVACRYYIRSIGFLFLVSLPYWRKIDLESRRQ